MQKVTQAIYLPAVAGVFHLRNSTILGCDNVRTRQYLFAKYCIDRGTELQASKRRYSDLRLCISNPDQMEGW